MVEESVSAEDCISAGKMMVPNVGQSAFGEARIDGAPRTSAKPRLLDLFCCAGGAGEGYARAGFDVTGVDIRPQPRYPHQFIQADCLALDPAWVAGFDAIHASPPCQAHTSLKGMHNAKVHEDLIPATRALLVASGLPWIMENVIGAPLDQPILLCGTAFGLGVEDAELRRHRLFETSFPILMVPQCQHGARATIGVYGGHIRNRRRTIGVYGEGVRDSRLKLDRGVPDFSIGQGRDAMGIDWMTTAELSQAIPPAYTEWLGKHLLAELAHGALLRQDAASQPLRMTKNEAA